MSLVFAAIVPHPPVLIPNIGKEHVKKIKKTQEAMLRLEQDLYSAKPDMVIIISPHGELSANAFTINLSNHFTANFELFGDFATKMQFPGDTVTFTVAKEAIAAKSPLNIISQPELDHGISVPLSILLAHLPQTPIVPVYFSMLDSSAHFEFGRSLKEMILNTDKRVAVIASGDLSHCLSTEAPAPFCAEGKIFDEKLIGLLGNHDPLSIINLDYDLIEKAAPCGLKSILILIGVLADMNYHTEIISYESPFGIGYLVAQMKLS